MTESAKPPFTLKDILGEQTRDLYNAESTYLSFLSEMDHVIENDDLHQKISEIALGSRKNIADLEAVCDELDIPPQGIQCHAMAGLLREAKETTQEYKSGAVKDAALIANAQRIAHYEIAGFGTAKAFASELNFSKASKLFKEMLERACEIDKALTKIATGSWLSSGINDRAVQGD